MKGMKTNTGKVKSMIDIMVKIQVKKCYHFMTINYVSKKFGYFNLFIHLIKSIVKVILNKSNEKIQRRYKIKLIYLVICIRILRKDVTILSLQISDI